MSGQNCAFIALCVFVAIAHAQIQVTIGKVGAKSLYLLESSHAISWDDAKPACERRRLRLAALTNSQENDLVSSFLAKRTPTADVVPVWLGGKKSDGKWVWIGSNTPLSYTNWDKGQPAEGKYNNCMYMIVVGDNKIAKWKATYCDMAYGLPVCQSL